MAPRHRVVIVAFPGSMSLDIMGPAEVFHHAGGYDVDVVAPSREAFEMSNGIGLVPTKSFADIHGRVDTLVVAGGEGTRAAANAPEFVAWIQRVAPKANRVASVCTGAFMLAEAGILDGRRATTHWAWCAVLASRYPAVRVDHDAIYIADGNVYTSAGITAGIDLALALVEEDAGPQIARDVAQRLVVFLRRPGGQSQFSSQLAALPADNEELRELQAWVPAHIDEDLSVPALAERVHMSERNFGRAFRRETGMTPAAYVESVRVEQARIALESSEAPLEIVARECGFGTVETMRRAFHRRLGVGPAAYRTRFQPLTEEVA